MCVAVASELGLLQYQLHTMAAASPAAPAEESSCSSARSAGLQLAELNRRSAKLGTWNVFVFHPRIEKYLYTDKSTGERKTGESFRCVLVSIEDQTCYIQAQVALRGTNREPLEKAAAKFTKSKCFCMSQVEFLPNASQAYLHAPLKQVVSLAKTKFDPLLHKADGQQMKAQPAMTLSEVQELQQNQLFDITALVAEIGEPTPAGSTGRHVRNIKLIDQSADGGKVQEVALSFFHDPTPSREERAMIDALDECRNGTVPLSFFAINGKKTDRGFSVANGKECFIVKAVGPRADELHAAADALQATPAEDRQQLEQGTFSARDYTQEQGMQCFCSILKTMMGKTNVKSIDEEDTLWQLNWTEVAWPSESDAEQMCTKDGQRLFFSTNIRDGTGVGPLVRMTEESALKLACIDSKDEFLEFHAAGKQSFPIMASIKVLRRARKGGGSQNDSADADQVNFIIVHVDDQPLHEGPTLATLQLFPWMRSASHDSASVVPSPLAFVKRCSHYAFQLQLPAKGSPSGSAAVIPCQKVLSLVKSSKPSKAEALGNTGFKIVTRGVEDMLADGAGQSALEGPASFTLSSTCTIENLPQYKLDPPRGGSQYALVSITAKIGDVFVVDQVQLLASEAAAIEAKQSLLQLIHLAREMGNGERKRNAPWTDSESPASAKKCRHLGRSPTEAPLPSDFMAELMK